MATPGSADRQPAAAGQAAALLRELASGATGAREALDGGDTAAALAAADAICAAAAQSRRLLKAAAACRKPRGTGTAAAPGSCGTSSRPSSPPAPAPNSPRTRSAVSLAGPPAPWPTPWTGSPPSGRHS